MAGTRFRAERLADQATAAADRAERRLSTGEFGSGSQPHRPGQSVALEDAALSPGGRNPPRFHAVGERNIEYGLVWAGGQAPDRSRSDARAKRAGPVPGKDRRRPRAPPALVV